ncbi:MAG TPA: hypothetical protein ENI88_10670 [Desulfobulbus sp.]|nr:hypothetical protein [Desulfobulbus sp.]
MDEPGYGMTEQRSEKRQQLSHSLLVYDGISSRIVGRVVDLTPKGMMLACAEPVWIQEEYRLRMTFADPVDNQTEVSVQAVCRWCREGVEPETFVAGFQFQKLLSEERRLLSHLIEEIGSF